MLPVLREQLKVINPWLEDDQVEEVVKQLTASFPGTDLIENNRHVFTLLAGKHQRQREPPDRREKPDRALRGLHPAGTTTASSPSASSRSASSAPSTTSCPDIVLFLNGLPVAVIECKSPKVKEPFPRRSTSCCATASSAAPGARAARRCFTTTSSSWRPAGNEAKFGTITTHSEKYFYRWADPYPRTVDDLAHGGSGPNDQQRLVAGMLDRDNLLDLIRTFTLFSTNDKGETIKIVGRYQQFRAVKLAVKRLLEGETRASAAASSGTRRAPANR